MESLGVLTFESDLPKYVSTGSSVILKPTFKCFLFDRKFHITRWDQGWSSTVRNGSAHYPQLIYIMSHHLFVEDCTHTCTQPGRDKHWSAALCAHACSVMDPPFECEKLYVVANAEVKVSVWQDIFLTLWLSLHPYLFAVGVSYSLFHCVVIGMCVCVLVRTVKLMNDQPWQIHSPDPGAAGEETNGKLGLSRSQS